MSRETEGQVTETEGTEEGGTEEGQVTETEGAEEGGTEEGSEETKPESREKRRGRPDSTQAANRILRKEIRQTREQMAQMQGAIETMQAVAAGQAGAQPRGQEGNPLDSLSPDEIHELWAEDPAKYNKLVEDRAYNRIRKELQQDFQRQEALNAQAAEERQDRARLNEVIKRTQKESQEAEKIGGDVPDFNELYESGEITEYMENNPGVDYEVAWERLTFDARMEAKVKAELDKRQKARDGKSKVPAAGKSGGRQPVGAKDDPRVKDPSKFGMSAEDVMAAKLREHRASQE